MAPNEARIHHPRSPLENRGDFFCRKNRLQVITPAGGFVGIAMSSADTGLSLAYPRAFFKRSGMTARPWSRSRIGIDTKRPCGRFWSPPPLVLPKDKENTVRGQMRASESLFFTSLVVSSNPPTSRSGVGSRIFAQHPSRSRRKSRVVRHTRCST